MATVSVNGRGYNVSDVLVIVPPRERGPEIHSHTLVWIDPLEDGTRVFAYRTPTMLDPGEQDPRD